MEEGGGGERPHEDKNISLYTEPSFGLAVPSAFFLLGGSSACVCVRRREL